MSSMWVGGFVPSILAMIVTPTLILTLILILGAILEFRCCVSHLTICHFWILLIWPPTATISVASIQQVAITQSIISIEISCRLPILTMLLALLLVLKNIAWEGAGVAIYSSSSLPLCPVPATAGSVCLAHCQPYFYLIKYILVQLAFIYLCFYTQSKNFWMDDVYFGRQLVAGCNPTVLRLCKEIPPG